MSGDVEVVVGRQDTEMIKVIGCAAVVSVCVLELSEGVESVDLLKSDLDQSK